MPFLGRNSCQDSCKKSTLRSIVSTQKLKHDKGLWSPLLASIRPGTMLMMENRSFGSRFGKPERRQKKCLTRRSTPKSLRPPTYSIDVICNLLVEHLRTMAFGFSVRLMLIQLTIWPVANFKDLQLWNHEPNKTRK